MNQCVSQCMFNQLCRTATYYADLETCRHFSTDSSQGILSDRVNAKVISFVNRSKETIDKDKRNSVCLALLGSWYLIESMTSNRYFHKSVFIPGMNAVQIVGGSNGFVDLSTTETFFALNGWFIRREDTSAVRRYHTVDRLTDRVISIVGGWNSITDAELYDLLVGISNATIIMNAPRAQHASAVIDKSTNSTTKLLLVGGQDGSGILDTGDIFSIETGVFTVGNNRMITPRSFRTVTAIGNGYVLVAGGINNNSVVQETLELYNSSSNLFVPLSINMSTPRAYRTTTYIPSIQVVLFVGGGTPFIALQTYDLFNVSTMTFTVLNGSTVYARAYHTATLLLDDQVLIVGGQNNVRLFYCELYNPILNAFTAVANMSIDRADHTAMLLANTGQMLVCGGQNQADTVLNSCEVYQ